ncbi:hypothetical protein I7G59_06555 [Sinorhizobium meliloti]|uniref:hypothetical protein n=1 Tax=Rhizobium meliloti TaxID=382 RepID=UPI002380A237|nr:hypothetical protein [Sinorhizobium meliloti]MDE3796995.1 hypothetical protein [Sinorhizobium meliloti]
MATAATVFRDYETDGVPASGSHKVKKSDVRQLLGEYENIINAFLSTGGLIFSSKSALDADLAHAANSMAWVIGDATVANNGVYRKIGASGVGSWTRMADLPFSFIIASDVGAGTPNAIQATTSIPVSSSALIWMNIFEANTASPVTVSFNGGSALTIKTNSGNDVTAGGLTAGMIVMGIVSGATFRLVSDQASAAIVAAAEAAQAAAEAAAASINIRQVAGRAALKALNSSFVTKAYLEGAGRSGWFSIYPSGYDSEIAADTREGMFIRLTDGGAAVRDAGWHVSGISPAWFDVISGPADGTFTTDSADGFIAAFAMSALVGAKVTVPTGFYLSSKRLDIPSGIVVEGLGTNEAWELPFFDLASATIHLGVTICFTGTGTRDLTLDYCSAMHHSGAYRTNISRPYMTANDQYFEATDWTNSNASGATKATLKSFSAAVTLGSDGLSGKTILRNIRFVPRCNDGANGPLAGYLATNMNSYIAWDEWDVGVVNYNPYTGLIEDCQFAGFWHMKGAVQTSIRFGSTTTGGRGEMAIWQRNWFQGGIAIRNGDFYPVLSKTANSVTIAWSPGHRFQIPGVDGAPASPTIFIDSTSYSYTGLVYNAAGSGTLEFTGIASTTNVVVAGDDRSTVHMTNNNGTTQTVFRDNNIRDFWHPSLVERPSTAFGAQAGKYSAAIEMVGYPIRGVTFENNTIYCQGPFFLLQIGARNIFWDKGTLEEKSYRTALGGALNPSGTPQTLAIVGPDTANVATWPMLSRGDATIFGYPWSGRTNIGPVGIVPGGYRYSAFNDCFNGYRYQHIGEPTTDAPIIWDARLPRTYTPTGTSDVDAALTVFDENVLVDHGGAPNPFIIVSLIAPWWIKRVHIKPLNSTDDFEFKQGTGAGQFSMGGNNIRLFSSLQGLVFVRNNAASAWTLEGNYGTNGTFASVTTVGGAVTAGTV